MPEDPNRAAPDPPPQRSIWSLETIGFIVIAVLILIFILIRYGRQIPWSAR